VNDIVAHRAEMLREYQNEAYADRYRALVQSAIQAENLAAPGFPDLAVAVGEETSQNSWRTRTNTKSLGSTRARNSSSRCARSSRATMKYA